MELLTSEEILNAEDLYKLQMSFSCSGIPFKYLLTEGEKEWLTFVSGRYSIADYIKGRLNGDIVTFSDPEELTNVLQSDGIENKAVMLSNETALQRLFFWLS
jgi:hypothetical protein